MKGWVVAALVTWGAVSFATENSNNQNWNCEKVLADGAYAKGSQAELLCSMMSRSTLGCAMDMLDMNLESDFVEAVEYCKNPNLVTR